MAQRKGQTGNPKGRKPGSVNKVTALTRQWLSDLLDGETGKIKTELATLTGDKYLKVITDLISYVIPKAAAGTGEQGTDWRAVSDAYKEAMESGS